MKGKRMDLRLGRKKRRTFSAAAVSVAVVSALALFSAPPCLAECAQNVAAGLQEGAGLEMQEKDRIYENEGLRLPVPAKYDKLVLTDVLTGDAKGMLFSVAEKASVDAAKKENANYKGAGWLFGIGRVDEAKLRDMLCMDMSGMEVFAKDDRGNHYVFYHPTDVRYVRESREAMQRDMEQWSMLNGWASGTVKAAFIRENAGLVAESFDDSQVSELLARVLYRPNQEYTVSTLEYGPMSPNGVDPAPYVAPLFYGASYRMVQEDETPDGEYVVLSFPKENCRLDFFLLSGKENYVRYVCDDKHAVLFLADFADKETRASTVMKKWYDALVNAKK